MKKKDFFNFINGWVERGVISGEQATVMKNDVQEDVSEKTGKKFISILLYMGITAISAGVLLLIASNWRGIPVPAKTLLILLLPLVPFCYTYYTFIVKNRSTVIARVVNMLSFAFVGGSLALIDQTYHLDVNWVSFSWTWALVMLPFVLLFKKKENIAYLVILIGVAIYSTVFDSVQFDSERYFIILCSVLSLVYTALVYGLGCLFKRLESWKESSNFLKEFATKFLMIFLFITTFKFYAKVLFGGRIWSSTLESGSWIAASVVLNLVFVAFLVFLAFNYIKSEEPQKAFGIVRLFVVYLLIKYVTLFSGMLDTGLFLILGGVIFVGGGWYLEKNKKHLIALMKDKNEEL